MRATRLIITALDEELAGIAAREFCGNASSVIGCDTEAGIERVVPESETIDGRPGVAVLAFAFDKKSLEKAVTARVGQNVLTCPTTACYSGLHSDVRKDRIKVGSQLRFFGDGYQISKKLDRRRFWRVPVMDGEFVCEDVVGTVKGIGGGNLLICGRSQSDTLAALAIGGGSDQRVGRCDSPLSLGHRAERIQSRFQIRTAQSEHQRKVVPDAPWANRERIAG